MDGTLLVLYCYRMAPPLKMQIWETKIHFFTDLRNVGLGGNKVLAQEGTNPWSGSLWAWADMPPQPNIQTQSHNLGVTMSLLGSQLVCLSFFSTPNCRVFLITTPPSFLLISQPAPASSRQWGSKSPNHAENRTCFPTCPLASKQRTEVTSVGGEPGHIPQSLLVQSLSKTEKGVGGWQRLKKKFSVSFPGSSWLLLGNGLSLTMA